jgi:hypothetical protein
MSLIPLIAAKVAVDVDDRIYLPKHIADQIPWMTGDVQIDCWLLVLSPGRFRILSDKQVESDARLESLKSLMVNGKLSEETEATFAHEPSKASMTVRLIPITAGPPKAAGRRVTLPKSMRIFQPAEPDPYEFTVLLSLEGYWEIWHTNVLRKATSSSL